MRKTGAFEPFSQPAATALAVAVFPAGTPCLHLGECSQAWRGLRKSTPTLTWQRESAPRAAAIHRPVPVAAPTTALVRAA